MIIRVDDVCANTDFKDLNRCADLLHAELGAEIWYCVNLFSKSSGDGAVYPGVPLRGKNIKFFYDVDLFCNVTYDIPSHVKLVSHGLLHSEHGNMPDGAQELSILTSCNYLKTNIFVPPFMSFDEKTKRICEKNKISLIDGKGWKSMESLEYRDGHDRWYFHHWRMPYKQVKEWICAGKVNA